MPKEFGRNQRVAQFIKEELSILVQREFPLQQYGMITLSYVDVSPDIKNATVYITALNSKLTNAALINELNEKSGHCRHEISRMMTSKRVPSIHFKYDESIARAQRLTDIIDSFEETDE